MALQFELHPDMSPAVAEELNRRMGLWDRLDPRGESAQAEPAKLKELGVKRGEQSIWRDLERTRHLTESGAGVTVALQPFGEAHDDFVAQDGILYRYPDTQRSAIRDELEVEATRSAGRLRLPVFVVTQGDDETQRRVRLGWVQDWDERSRLFLIRFDVDQQPSPWSEGAAFRLMAPAGRRLRQGAVRVGAAQFRLLVFKRYGHGCAVCDVAEDCLLVAVPLCPAEEGGAQDPRNGLPLCLSHQRALERGLFAIRPDDYSLVSKPGVEGKIGLTRGSLAYLPERPHPDALLWRWRRWTQPPEPTPAAGQP